MDKTFLEFIWEYSRFDHRNLCSQTGEKVEIIHPGYVNPEEGPDFIHATIQIGDELWRGGVVIHMDGEDYYGLNQDSDAKFSNVILNVCFRNVRPISNIAGYKIASLELNGKISDELINYYDTLQQSSRLLACKDQLTDLDPIRFDSMRDKLVHERFEQKKTEIYTLLENHKWDWDKTFFHLLVENAAAMPGKTAFHHLANILNYRLIFEHRDSIYSIEAILFGQSGLLEGEFKDSYPKMLQATYRDLSSAYQLDQLDTEIWKNEISHSKSMTFIRLAQLAHLLCQNESVFNYLLDSQDPYYALSNLSHSFYWDDHDDFDRSRKTKHISIVNRFADHMMIHVLAPALYAYGQSIQVQDICLHAGDILKTVRPEANRKTRLFADMALSCKNASDSLAVDQLLNNYCVSKNCVDCPVGCHALRSHETIKFSVRNITEYDYIYN